MLIGTVDAGRVDGFAGEHCFTQFFAVGPILIPLKSYYESERGTFELPVRLKSVVHAYLRTVGVAVAVIALLFVWDGPTHFASDQSYSRWVQALAISAPLVLWSMFMAGRTSRAVNARRALLMEVVGVGALPEWFPEYLVRRTRRGLRETWDANRRHWGESKDWREAARAGARDPEARKLVAVLASYDAAQTGARESRVLSELAWGHALRASPRAGSLSELQRLAA
jgi:hypothetical protein